MRPWIVLLFALGLAVAAASPHDSAGGARMQAAGGTAAPPPWTALAGDQPACWRDASDEAPVQRPLPAQIGMGIDGDLAALTRLASCLRQLHLARIS